MIGKTPEIPAFASDRSDSFSEAQIQLEAPSAFVYPDEPPVVSWEDEQDAIRVVMIQL